MLWFVTLTQDCNYSCTYCGSDENFDIEDLSPYPHNVNYDIDHLKKLNEEKELALCFYGGEPLLRIDLIEKIVEMIPKAKFILQTNASMLHKLPTHLLVQMDTILCSVDGDSNITNLRRGKNSYERTIKNAKDARDRGYTGDLIARMTVGDCSEIHRDVTHLLTLEHNGKLLFDHVHWQLNVQWDTPAYASYKDFFGWRDQSYNPGITQLADDFVAALKNGRILGITPFLGVLWSHLTNEKFETVRCSSGWESFNVATNGEITACPIAPELASLGNIVSLKSPQSVHHKEKVGEPCTSCEVLHECGGRCLYCNKTQWWDEQGFLEVCVTVKHLLKEIREKILPVVKEEIAASRFQMEDFHYPKYNNSTEIIP
ncbi:radical SAM domain containing protein [Tritrichomonas foetus]|uniref:Radical SAM domain containing protein n=1 Tax=Tritrichomonas foetus TaxID=1144522 RepID=A0A1J4JVP6_9EUKA|nr:radical SAM domain containing protein [Tritrichomonas foetus]|eukprot:OHT01357.1 radical SAM domain containing protein [Tritrichomonas foetus]